MTVHVCTSENMHPYNCLGRGKCRHCDMARNKQHNPRNCWLCWDGDPDGEPGPLSTYRANNKRFRLRRVKS